MSKKNKNPRPKARRPRGFRDQLAEDVSARLNMVNAIRSVFELYGFDPVETSAIEYVDALGKYLPDTDRPMGGVFGFQDDDEQWIALRYDLTAPLARLVAEGYDALAKPFRRYQVGSVWRNEKPGPGRFREFMQFDADTVGTAAMAADAELCMMVADALGRLGLSDDDYVVRINNRKVLNGVLQSIGLGGDDDGAAQSRLTVLRAMDKLDRLGADGVRLLLGGGRKDDSGDFTKGAGLSDDQIDLVMGFVGAGVGDNAAVCARLRDLVGNQEIGVDGVNELEQIAELIDAGGYNERQLKLDPSVVRGLAYYTGPVFEAELTFEVENEKGQVVQFGSVAGGGRYDDLVKRFKGVEVPATGISIGVDRLLAALRARKLSAAANANGPVVVLVMDQAQIADYQLMTRELRAAGVRAEMYVGTSGMRAQMKYADKRGAPIAVIAGEDERAKGVVTLKDLALGSELSSEIETSEEWRKGQPAQVEAARVDLVVEVRSMLGRAQARSGNGAAP
jgi:histidyl-tRNA synthetase